MQIKLLLPISILIVIVLTAGTIDLNNLFPYEAASIPNYINKDNAPNSPTDNALATLGRVLFYDKNLSANNTVACASCHQQAFAFGDPAVQSIGLNGGLTGRHSMRLINTRYANENRFFWDERANSLEDQTTQPIQDHIEMGFSGTNGDLDFNDLITKLEAISYYQELFSYVYGDGMITETRMQEALAQFIRSIQSFDARYDEGLALVNGNINAPFPNFTPQENLGKTIFTAPPNGGPNGNGAGCQGCHQAPEFDIDSNSNNNGVIGVAGDPTAIDLTNTRAPTLRDIVNPDGTLNGPLMHDGSMTSLMQVIDHYNMIPINPQNNNLDNRLLEPPTGPGNPPTGQNLNLTQDEKDALIAFLGTLTGTEVYTANQWSDPFNAEGNLDLVLVSATEILLEDTGVTIFSNPTENNIHLELASGNYVVEILDAGGTIYRTITFCDNFFTIDIAQLPVGLYYLKIQNTDNHLISVETILKQ